jgi:acetolactate synthase regulatory subunit
MVSVTKEQQLAELVVKSTKPKTTAINQLAKVFKKLSINLL